MQSENVYDQIKIVEETFHRSCEICDIPGPYLIWCCRTIRCGLAVFARFLAPPPVVLHFFFIQYPIEGGFGGNIFTIVCQSWYNLAWRHAGKAFLVHCIEDPLPFLRAQLV